MYLPWWPAQSAVAVALLLALPLTFLSLMVFRLSMRRAKVRTIHVVRCVVYSFDLLFLMGAGLLAYVLLVLADCYLSFHFGIAPLISVDRGDMLFWSLLLFETILFYRLWMAYRNYLRFDRPFLTILASQAIVFLAIMLLLFHLGLFD